MTPNDIKAIRERAAWVTDVLNTTLTHPDLRSSANYLSTNVAALCDALEEAMAEIERLRECMLDATAHLCGATSAYETFAVRHKKRPQPDALFSTRLSDFQKACERARAALKD